MDGQGYPDGLAGDEIPLPARIVLVADAFDALTTDRPYRRRAPAEAALEEIAREHGHAVLPEVVAALERLYREEPASSARSALTVRRVGLPSRRADQQPEPLEAGAHLLELLVGRRRRAGGGSRRPRGRAGSARP